MTEADPLSLVVADVNWFSTGNLFRELDEPDVSLLTLRCMDYRNGWRMGIRPWSTSRRLRQEGPRHWSRDVLLAPGWMKQFPRLGMRSIVRAAKGFWSGSEPPARRGLVATYPHYLHLLDASRPDLSLYYNLDDYSLYWPMWADKVRRLERMLIERADSTVCVSRLQAETFRKMIPEAASRIHHIPHGTPTHFLASRPMDRPAIPPADLAELPRPILGYVGTLEDRLDWPLLEDVSRAFPKASLVLIGRMPSGRDAGDSRELRDRVVARPNVHAVGWRRQTDLPDYFQSFDVNLIPYRVDHPFNRACSPTKIMDGMGATRPIVSTAVPECRLYTRYMDVADSHDDFLNAIARILDRHSDDGRAELRRGFAAMHTCAATASRVIATMRPRG